MNAANGRVVATIKRHSERTWFAALTDRDPAAGSDCPGGSSARIPFGVLTRTEERYAAGPSEYRSAGTVGSTHLVLSTVPAVNRADPGMYGGCVLQNCSINELVWVTITIDRARPGHTLRCLPWSYPAGYHPRKVKETFTVDVPNNDVYGCGPVPRPFRELKDLAPALP